MRNKITKLLFLVAPLISLIGCESNNSSSNSSQSESESSSRYFTYSETSYADQDKLTYDNPIFNVSFPDPAVIKGQDGFYYCYGTSSTQDWGGSVGYRFLGVPIIQSKDMVHWQCVGGIFENKGLMPNWGTAGASVWAPDVVYLGGQYICYYSLSTWGDANPGIGIATSPTPTGPWKDHGKLFLSSEIGVLNSIDPCCFIDDDGSVYLFWGSFAGTYAIEMEEDGMSIKEGAQKKLVAGFASNSWNGNLYEGTYVRKIDGLYYMFLSTGTCCDGYSSTYHVVCCMAEEPLGPYYDDNDREMAGYSNRGTLVVQGNNDFVGTGHISLAQDDAGDYYMFFHAYNLHGSEKKRVLLMQKLITDDGFVHLDNYEAKVTCDKPFIK